MGPTGPSAFKGLQGPMGPSVLKVLQGPMGPMGPWGPSAL